MRTKLADTRIPATLAETEEAVKQLAAVELRIAVAKAEAEEQINAVKARLDAAIAADAARKDALETRILRYVDQNPDQFVRPRSIKTDFGKFGLRKSTRIAYSTPKETVLQHLIDAGIETAVKRTVAIHDQSLKELLKDGEDIPGASLEDGEIAFVEIHKALLKNPRPLDLSAVEASA